MSSSLPSIAIAFLVGSGPLILFVTKVVPPFLHHWRFTVTLLAVGGAFAVPDYSKLLFWRRSASVQPGSPPRPSAPVRSSAPARLLAPPPVPSHLKDRRVVLVTGGNRGIGYEVVRLVASDGLHAVVLTARDDEAGRLMAEKAGIGNGSVVFCPLDVLDEGSIKAAVNFVTTNFGRLDVLVNNAGVSFGPSVEPPQTRQSTVATNVQGVLKVTDAFRPLLVAAKGQVVNVGSVSGRLIFQLGTPDFKEKIKRACTNRASLSVLGAKLVSGIAPWRPTDSVYGASKLLAHMVTRILAFEYQRDGIEVPVRSVCPGYVSTRIGGPMAPLTPEQGAEVVVGLVRERTDIQTGCFWTRTGVRDDCAWDVAVPSEPASTE
mmetsp:Transcript_66253/g.175515  ORF Transcript_66253/g.175515 Transcript_66253/m.175515 type:complete len:375 (-) Transcript_66253:93-1217(-)